MLKVLKFNALVALKMHSIFSPFLVIIIILSLYIQYYITFTYLRILKKLNKS